MSLASLIATGTKVWLDGVEPDEIKKNRAWGITGATSNPTIISKIIESGHFDARIGKLIEQGLTDEQIAWELDDELVKSAQQVFLPVWEQTKGNDGYVSFELDPLIEDEAAGLDNSQRVRRYVELAEKWSAGHKNRMIKVPASAAGLEALEAIAATGVTINVTLMFTQRQYQVAPRRHLARSAATQGWASRFQKRLQHLCVACRCLHGRTCSRPEPGRTGNGRNRQRQTDLAGESGVLEKQRAAAATGNRFRQHWGQETRCPAGQVCGGAGRKRYPDEPPGHESSRGEIDEGIHTPDRPDAVAKHCQRNRQDGGHGGAGAPANGRRHQEIRRAAEGAAESYRSKESIRRLLITNYERSLAICSGTNRFNKQQSRNLSSNARTWPPNISQLHRCVCDHSLWNPAAARAIAKSDSHHSVTCAVYFSHDKSKRPADPIGFVSLLKRSAGVIASSSGREARDEDHRGMERDRVTEAA